MKSAIIAVVGVAVGIGIGFIIPRTSDDDAITNNPTPNNQVGDGDSPRVSDRGDDNNSSKPSNTPPSDGSSNNVTHQYNDPDTETVVVPKKLITALSYHGAVPSYSKNLFLGDGKVEEALEITDYEKAEIQTAWRLTQQKIRDMETTSMKTEEVDDSTVKITIPDMSDLIKPLGGNFQKQLRSSLGKDRADAFIAAKQVDRIFSSEPGEQSYTVTPESTGDGTWRFRLSMEGPSGRKVWVGENIPEELRHLTDAARILPSFNGE